MADLLMERQSLGFLNVQGAHADQIAVVVDVDPARDLARGKAQKTFEDLRQDSVVRLLPPARALAPWTASAYPKLRKLHSNVSGVAIAEPEDVHWPPRLHHLPLISPIKR